MRPVISRVMGSILDPFPASIVGPVCGRMPFARQEMSYGGIPMPKMRQLRSSGGGILTPY
jgi:hypothetical protein